MAARLSCVAERINVEMQRMMRPVDTLSGLAPLLRVRPELQQLCRFGAPILVPSVGGVGGFTHSFVS